MTVSKMEYFFTYRTNVKERWKNRALIDILVSEFRTRTREYFEDAIKHGVVTINNKKVTAQTKLAMQDVIYHTVHMHEPEQLKIPVLAVEDDYTVVNKPTGIPCHPTGGYINYTVTKSLFGDAKVACVNRLDMPVSGVLIISTKNYAECLQRIKETKKIYVAKVKGKFYDKIEVNKKIKVEEGRRRYVSDDGKDCRTVFRRLRYKNGFSLVECEPITGRTHQIRIHLQSLGFPVINDVIYGDAILDKVLPPMNCKVDISGYEHAEKYGIIKKYCKGGNNRSFILKDYHICLHAWKYVYDGKEYEAEIPEWCNIE